MIDTKAFLNKLINLNYSHLCVVPCSFARNLINVAINFKGRIEYIPCASEAVACSVAAGLKLSGAKPIVIVQSSGLTNMASCITSLLVPYGINISILTSWREYKSGDSEIQHEHLSKKLPELIGAYGYDYEILDQNDLEKAVTQIETSQEKKIICILKNNTFSKVDLNEEHKLDLSLYTPRSIFLKKMNEMFKQKDFLFIGTTGNTSREMYSYMPNTNNFYMAGNMGGALSLGLGASKAGKKVIVCGGDAEFVMHLGGLTTAGRYKNEIDLTYILFDNESNKSTGGQKTYQDHVDYLNLASSAGFEVKEDTIIDQDKFIDALNRNIKKKGSRFIHVKCGYDKEAPRPSIESIKVNYFKD